MTLKEFSTLRHFRGTGRHVGKDALLKTKMPKSDMELNTLLKLRRHYLLDHFCGGDWFLTDAGREFLRNPEFYAIQEV